MSAPDPRTEGRWPGLWDSCLKVLDGNASHKEKRVDGGSFAREEVVRVGAERTKPDLDNDGETIPSG